ncbi:MAG TPA: RNA polymerase sigma factor [Asticcacaulis sp.]|nr:RNA polymerase sigma factor [Asticcacaulis sp.]
MSAPSPSKSVLLKAYLEKRVILLRYFTRLAGDSALAEDIVQDLYLKITALSDDYEVEDPVAFLFKMAHNVYLNQLRALQSGRNRDSAWSDLSRHRIGGDDVADEPSPEAQTAGRQQLQKAMGALGELPDKTQAIFRLHKFDGLSQADVASRLDISLSSVEKHLSSALRHLMQRLKTGP